MPNVILGPFLPQNLKRQRILLFLLFMIKVVNISKNIGNNFFELEECLSGIGDMQGQPEKLQINIVIQYKQIKNFVQLCTDYDNMNHFVS